jgi:uncharacterized protein HemX
MKENLPVIAPTKNKNRFFIFLAFSIALLSLVLSIVALMMLSANKTENATQLPQLQQQLQDQQSSITNVQSQTQSAEATLENMQARLERMTKLIYDPKKQQQFSQITFLLNLANLYLTLQKDSQNSQFLLKQALQQMNAINDVALDPLRKVVARSIAKLESISPFNKSDLISKLDTLNVKIRQLPFVPKNFTPTSTPKTLGVSTPPTQTWTQMLTRHLSDVTAYIRIRRTNAALPPLALEQQQLIKENLSAKIIQTEWAVLHGDADLYQRNIKLIKQWLLEYFYHGAELQDVLAQLNALALINVHPDLPNLNAIFTMLNSISITPPSPAQPSAPTVPKSKVAPGGVAV